MVLTPKEVDEGNCKTLAARILDLALDDGRTGDSLASIEKTCCTKRSVKCSCASLFIELCRTSNITPVEKRRGQRRTYRRIISGDRPISSYLQTLIVCNIIERSRGTGHLPRIRIQADCKRGKDENLLDG
ncbi:hypothetical protein BV898_16695 [Hypsibius exemplaris]|uniref:Uncharacterized protein n=1 Tax=Hypsibius exemplaris TaxID=2072580 RepID=A0A9X6RM32_HYPEX|nr:hypothetical protein BV898_16695 [Hypsibius exemplaris]